MNWVVSSMASTSSTQSNEEAKVNSRQNAEQIHSKQMAAVSLQTAFRQCFNCVSLLFSFLVFSEHLKTYITQELVNDNMYIADLMNHEGIVGQITLTCAYVLLRFCKNGCARSDFINAERHFHSD